MKICIIGTGYVGLVAGACFAETGNDVICVDNDLKKLAQLESGITPIYEPGLDDLIKTNVANGRLKFTADLDSAVKATQVCFIAVGTPQDDDGAADLTHVEQVAADIAKAMNGYKIIVDKSTVPVGTGEKVAQIIAKHTKHDFDLVSNPEFLKQGAAVDDFLRPDRVVIGTNSERAKETMLQLYEPFVKNQNPIITMDVRSAEMVKYASNAFLAVKISYANEIANICEQVGADASKVRLGMCADSRIGTKFLYPGLGYGGSCFPKDVKAIMNFASSAGCPSSLLKATDDVNKKQRQVFINKILNRFGEDLTGMTFAVWGLAFKPKTNDMREAPAITIINALLKRGAKIKAYDPKAMDNAREIFAGKKYRDVITYADTSYGALEGTDCLLLLTEWSEFRTPDFERIKAALKLPIIFDGRNQYDAKVLSKFGIEYHCIGRKAQNIEAINLAVGM